MGKLGHRQWDGGWDLKEIVIARVSCAWSAAQIEVKTIREECFKIYMGFYPSFVSFRIGRHQVLEWCLFPIADLKLLLRLRESFIRSNSSAVFQKYATKSPNVRFESGLVFYLLRTHILGCSSNFVHLGSL